MVRVSVVCSDERHPVWPHLEHWVAAQAGRASAELVRRCADLSGGEIVFLISCSELVRPEVRAQYTNSFVIHASDLPKQRGWSPYIWALLEGASEVTVTLLAAKDPVDSGDIYHQARFAVARHELLAEVMAKLIAAELELMDWAVSNFGSYAPRAQVGEPSWCPRRRPDDSRIDPEQSLASQFDIIRLSDAERFPAYFDLHGERFAIRLTKMEQDRP